MVKNAVVPGYYLVCYNLSLSMSREPKAVVPGYYLVCYNKRKYENSSKRL